MSHGNAAAHVSIDDNGVIEAGEKEDEQLFYLIHNFLTVQILAFLNLARLQ